MVSIRGDGASKVKGDLVWNVAYSYMVSLTSGGGGFEDKVYSVVACSEAEALQKGDQCFTYRDENKTLLAEGAAEGTWFRLSDLQRSAKVLQDRVVLPRLALGDDATTFDI